MSSSSTALKKHKADGSTVVLSELVSVCYSLASEAGVIIRDVMESGNLDVVDKSNEKKAVDDGEEADDPQTIADIRAQKLIVSSLKKAFPTVRLVGEEGELATTDKHISKNINPKSLESELSSLPEDIAVVEARDLVVWIGMPYSELLLPLPSSPLSLSLPFPSFFHPCFT